MDNAIPKQLLLSIILVLIPQTLTSHAHTCSNYTFPKNLTFRSCRDLPVLQARLHWNYVPSTKSVHVAFRAASTGWAAWAINPNGTGMVGSQAIVAFRGSNGGVTVYPTAITDKNPSMQPSSLSFGVSNVSAEYVNGEMIIFAVVGPLADWSLVNHVWQAGDSVSKDIPEAHRLSGPNIQSTGTLDFVSA